MQGAEGQLITARPGRRLVPRTVRALALRQGVFSFLQWLRQSRCLCAKPCRWPGASCGGASLRSAWSSHAKRLQINERENRRRAPEDVLLVQYAGFCKQSSFSQATNGG